MVRHTDEDRGRCIVGDLSGKYRKGQGPYKTGATCATDLTLQFFNELQNFCDIYLGAFHQTNFSRC